MSTPLLLQQLQSAASRHLPPTLDWLRRMVECNSFTTNATGVDALGRLTAECFAPLSFESDFVPSRHPDHGHHLFLRRRPRTTPRHPQPIVLVTHLDTVFPAEEERRQQFHWRPDPTADCIYGPGTVDNKGGTALIWLMLQMLQEVAPDFLDQTDLLIAANAAEEVIGSDFAERTAERCPDGARCVLVFEGGPIENTTDYHLVTARKGRYEFRIDSHGRAAHAGSKHHEGINAVVELARLLPQIAALSDPATELTVNIASIQGGTVLNRVPHHASAELEMRAYDPSVLAQAEAALSQLAGPSPGGAQIEVTCCGRTQGWPGGPGTDALFKRWAAAASQIGLQALPKPRGGLSDANYLSSLGPTLDALGPFGTHAHCSEHDPANGKFPERVYPNSFVPKALLNTLALLDLPPHL
jgi:glutamate carboxypeptidase